MFVVVTDVDREDSFEVSSVHDQDPVETFATDGADPISWLATRSGHLPAKDRELVTQDEYLDLVRGV
jgi:hypothetical protein